MHSPRHGPIRLTALLLIYILSLELLVNLIGIISTTLAPLHLPFYCGINISFIRYSIQLFILPLLIAAIHCCHFINSFHCSTLSFNNVFYRLVLYASFCTNTNITFIPLPLLNIRCIWVLLLFYIVSTWSQSSKRCMNKHDHTLISLAYKWHTHNKQFSTVAHFIHQCSGSILFIEKDEPCGKRKKKHSERL